MNSKPLQNLSIARITGEIAKRETAMKILILLALIALSTAQLQLREEWEAWKREHGKSYADDMEESLRHAIWFQNYHYIEVHNKEKSFKLGLNEFADLVRIDIICIEQGVLLLWVFL